MKEVKVEEVDRCWPRPERVILVTSVDEQGHPNIITVGWTMRANGTPPVFAVGLNMKSRSCQNITAGGGFVMAVPGAQLARESMYCGSHTGTDVDKFSQTGLTPVPGNAVQAPLIQECLANLECKLIHTQDMADHRVFFGEVVACWESTTGGKPLLIVGEEEGYELLHESGRFRLGAVRG